MRLLLSIISFLVLLSSCKKGEVPSPSPDPDVGQLPEKIEVNFGSDISYSIEEYNLSKAPIEGEQLPVGAKVGIYGVKANSNNWDDYYFGGECQENLENAEYTVNEGGRLYQKYLAIYPTKDTEYNALVFYAYHPYTKDIVYDRNTRNYYIPVDFNEDDMSATEDYLYTGRRNQITPSDENRVVNLPFKHALGRIRFVFNQTSSDANVEYISIYANSSYKGKMFIDKGECKPDNTSPRAFDYILGKNLKYGEVTADFMMFPGVNIVDIQCKINGQLYFIYFADDPGTRKINLEAGKITTFRINFNPKEASFSNSVDGWDEKDNHDLDIDESTGGVTVKKEP